MAGLPHGWGSYITVEDVDDTADRCEMLGGKVLFGPTDLGLVGRFAVLQDNQGAVFNVIAYEPPE
jgi:predicted enzyme related to lactoylglutathione lyase